MNDFSGPEEARHFSLLPPLPPAKQAPLTTFDSYCHGLSLMNIGVSPDEYNELMTRFSKIFRQDAKIPGGGSLSLKHKGIREVTKFRRKMKKLKRKG